MIEDMHHWYHGHGEKVGVTDGALAGLHVYDSIVVLEKAAVPRPQHTKMRDGDDKDRKSDLGRSSTVEGRGELT